jgi:hypothetical protein
MSVENQTRLGILTSCGENHGMNVTVLAITRTALGLNMPFFAA